MDLLGPVLADTSWQTRAAAGLSTQDFRLDWVAKTATCPQGQQSVRWQASTDRHKAPVLRVSFADRDCAACPTRSACTRSTTKGRTLTLRPQAAHQALQAARQQQTTPAFQVA